MIRCLLLVACCCAPLAAADPVHPTLPFDLDQLRLVDEVDLAAADPGHRFTAWPEDAVVRGEILGRPALQLPNEGDLKYVSVRLGEGQGLESGGRYVLAVDYPEDQPRSFVISNLGCETRRGLHTGTTVGDALDAKYVGSNSESLDLPLSGGWRTWTQCFRLHPRTPSMAPTRDAGHRDLGPADGFTVTISQWAHKHAPLSHGVAVARVRLYALPADADLAAPLAELPEDLPRRHVFWREEMADGVVGGRDPAKRGFPDGEELDWYRYKLELAQFLGVNTYAKDLLEFGHNQGWDSSRYGGNQWVYQSHSPWLWSAILDLVAETELAVMPYYEYAGSVGGSSLGRERRCQTLHRRGKGKDGQDAYTHIAWSEKVNADVTDPDTVEDLRRILEITVVDEAADVPFAGVWLRPRNSGMPVSFSQTCIDRYNADTGSTTTLAELQREGEAYEAYWRWWLERRADFLRSVQGYLAEEVGDIPVLLTTDPSEAGRGIGRKAVVTDDPGRWRGKTDVPLVPWDDAVAQDLAFQAQLARRGTWGGWEWQHSVPPADPATYADDPAVALTYGFNTLYSVSNPAGLDAFRSGAGLAMIRHHHLNENMMSIGGDRAHSPLGYFVTDVELTGPYCVLAEARALANGDPRYLGYLAAASYQRGFAHSVRAFNRAFLAHPAVPSERLESASGDGSVVVRRYPTADHGTWYAVINTGYHDAVDVPLLLEEEALVDCLDGSPVALDAGAATASLYPGQVLAGRI